MTTAQWKWVGDGLEPPYPISRQETLEAILAQLGLVKVSAGAGQMGLSVTSSAPTYLTVPDGATNAEIYVRTASVVFRRSGVAPTATAGFQADATDIILLVSADQLKKFGAIAVSAT